MAELEIEGTFEEQWGIVKSAVKDHHVLLHGNGKEGLVQTVTGWQAQARLIVGLVVGFGSVSTIGLVVLGILEYLHGR